MPMLRSTLISGMQKHLKTWYKLGALTARRQYETLYYQHNYKILQKKIGHYGPHYQDILDHN